MEDITSNLAITPDEVSIEVPQNANLPEDTSMRSEEQKIYAREAKRSRWKSQNRFLQNSTSLERIPVLNKENVIKDFYASRNVKTVQSSQKGIKASTNIPLVEKHGD